MSQPLPSVALRDRPGWIPSHLKRHWDSDPYAYQTEEELMPAGGPHGQLLGYLLEVLRVPLEDRQLMLLPDTFMLYRDVQGIQQRVAPDLLLMPWCNHAPSAYNLEVEPPPLFVAEVTSKKSHLKDLEKNVPFYVGLGIQAYLVIDAITPTNQPRKQIQLHLWRVVDGQPVKIAPDPAGRWVIPELGVSVSVWGRRFRFEDLATGEVLQDSQELRQALETEARRAKTEAQRADAEAQARQAEAQRADAEAQARQVEAQRADAEAQARQAEAQRADAEAQRAETEAAARHAAEAELARLKAFLADKGYPTS